MRRLLPGPSDAVDLWEAYRSIDTDSAEGASVRVNMVSSLDGAIAVQGRARGLGSPGDRYIFNLLRAQADVVLVGAQTVRVERYGPVRLDEDLAHKRRAAGIGNTPPIAVLTHTAALDWESRFFTQATTQPLVITGKTGAGTASVAARGRAEIVTAGDDRVDLARAIAALHARGFRNVLCEGGPTVNGELVTAGLIDELCLTIAMQLVQGDGPRLATGLTRDVPIGFEIVHLLEEDGFLFLRLKRR